MSTPRKVEIKDAISFCLTGTPKEKLKVTLDDLTVVFDACFRKTTSDLRKRRTRDFIKHMVETAVKDINRKSNGGHCSSVEALLFTLIPVRPDDGSITIDKKNVIDCYRTILEQESITPENAHYIKLSLDFFKYLKDRFEMPPPPSRKAASQQPVPYGYPMSVMVQPVMAFPVNPRQAPKRLLTSRTVAAASALVSLSEKNRVDESTIAAEKLLELSKRAKK